jgi:DNA-binding NtrC family response regulator
MNKQAKVKILVVDDEPIKRAVLEDELREAGYDVAAASHPLEAESILEKSNFDVVLTDLRMPGQDGIGFLRELKEKRPEQNVIVMTAYGTVETAVEAMKSGAFDYIQKPFSTEELLLKLDRLLRYEGLSGENKALRLALKRTRGETQIVGNSEAIREILATIHAVSDTDSSVLISGESGTGKELVARVIHETSHRSAGRFVAVSCAALPKELVESELFGHELGAFTGATKRRIGRFELAHGGTLFLDDVDDIPTEVQVKLLRALQERSFERVGGEKPVHVNVRVLAGTKKSLPGLVEAGLFREDLFYRLNVVPLDVPPLRNRLDDVPLLVNHFLQKLAVKSGRGDLTISKAAVAKLQRHPWPGNIRELEHLLERVIALNNKKHLDEQDIPDLVSSGDVSAVASLSLDNVGNVDLAAVLADVENRLLRWALDRAQGNLAQTAAILNIPRSTLQYKITKLETPSSPSRPREN